MDFLFIRPSADRRSVCRQLRGRNALPLMQLASAGGGSQASVKRAFIDK